jgi:trans-aconitate 2-methyltransferase
VSHDPWDPTRYNRFQRERAAPFFDLLGLVCRRPGMRVADLGCGTGELTRLLHRELQAAETLGIDSSPAMLRRSERFAGAGLRFAPADVAAWTPDGPLDLAFSNAALHWLPDHEALLARLTGMLAPEGQLAVQMPANHDHASHLIAGEVAAESPFREALGGFVRDPVPVMPPERYADLLARLGYAAQHVRLQVYGHRLGETADVARWVQGTLLTAYESRLPPDLYERFFARYRELLVARLGDARPYFFPFKRILLWARR